MTAEIIQRMFEAQNDFLRDFCKAGYPHETGSSDQRDCCAPLNPLFAQSRKVKRGRDRDRRYGV